MIWACCRRDLDMIWAWFRHDLGMPSTQRVLGTHKTFKFCPRIHRSKPNRFETELLVQRSGSTVVCFSNCLVTFFRFLDQLSDLCEKSVKIVEIYINSVKLLKIVFLGQLLWHFLFIFCFSKETLKISRRGQKHLSSLSLFAIWKRFYPPRMRIGPPTI